MPISITKDQSLLRDIFCDNVSIHAFPSRNPKWWSSLNKDKHMSELNCADENWMNWYLLPMLQFYGRFYCYQSLTRTQGRWPVDLYWASKRTALKYIYMVWFSLFLKLLPLSLFTWWDYIYHLTTVYITSLGVDETALDRAISLIFFRIAHLLSSFMS